MNNYQQFLVRFKRNKRGLVSFFILSSIFLISLFAEFIANDKPLLIKFKDQYFFPIFQNISEVQLGGELLKNFNFGLEYLVLTLKLII
jgi:microcin C transport system permease protein